MYMVVGSLLLVFLHSFDHHRELHSFPTRRSSDLTNPSGRSVHKAEAHVAAGVFDAIKVTRDALDLRRPHLARSEEHTSELQSHSDLVCRLLLEKKKHSQTSIRVYASHPTDEQVPD